MTAATLILEDGVVFPGDGPPAPGHSVALVGDRIAAVGPHREVARLAGKSTDRLDLRGRSLVPGFIESHTCFATDCRKVGEVNLAGKARGAEELGGLLRAAAAETEPDDWVVAAGYSEDASAGAGPLRAADLDRMVPERPVALFAPAMDLCVLNGMGMQALQLATAADAPDVEAERDRALRPNGRFRGRVTQILPDGFPCFEVPALTRRMARLGKRYLRLGITSIHDIDVYRALDMAAYLALRREEALPLRVVALLRGFPRDDGLRRRYAASGLGTGFGDDWLRLGAMKFSVDGLMGRKTAAVSGPWDGVEGRHGQMFFTQEEVVERIREVTEAGFQVAFHANGDRAIELVLGALKMARSLLSRPIARPRIHHCTLPDPAHIKMLKELGAIPIGHPHFIRFMGDAHLRSLGEERIRLGYFPLRSFLDEGIPAVLASEPVLPLERIHPLIGISAAMTRKSLEGQVLAPEERVSLEAAVRMYTGNAAWAAFEEGVKGTVAPGKLADLAILERDLRQVDADALAGVQVDYTILGGKVVFARG